MNEFVKGAKMFSCFFVLKNKYPMRLDRIGYGIVIDITLRSFRSMQ